MVPTFEDIAKRQHKKERKKEGIRLDDSMYVCVCCVHVLLCVYAHACSDVFCVCMCL